MTNLTRTASWSLGLVGLLVLTILLSASIGSVEIHPLDVAKSVLNTLAIPSGLSVSLTGGSYVGADLLPFSPTFEFHWQSLFDFPVKDSHQTIVVIVRLPRIMLAAVVGFGLAAAGTVMQGFFRNPLADPAIIGVSSGAAVGAVLAISAPMLLPFGLRPAAFVGGIAAAALVYTIATEDGRTPVATLLLAGIAIQTFLGAVISYLLLHSGESMREVVYWLMGHLHASSWSDVAFAGSVTALLFVGLAFYARDLNILLLGEEEAQHLGVPAERVKTILLGLSSAVTAAAVAVSGVIGFVGLIVPHMLRLVVGPDHRILLPTAALGGATFLVAADTIARIGAAEAPVGIITAAVGAPFFLYLLMRRKVYSL